jgi:hypothetical protein
LTLLGLASSHLPKHQSRASIATQYAQRSGERLRDNLATNAIRLPPTLLKLFANSTMPPRDKIETEMKDFSNASFPPETIGIMKKALDAAVATLPEPVSSAHVQSIAETILRTAKDGERDPTTLQRMALIELQISPRH